MGTTVGRIAPYEPMEDAMHRHDRKYRAQASEELREGRSEGGTTMRALRERRGSRVGRGDDWDLATCALINAGGMVVLGGRQ